MNQKNAAQSYFSRALGASTKPSKSIIASEEAVVLTVCFIIVT
jgi:hypothetical protein